MEQAVREDGVERPGREGQGRKARAHQGDARSRARRGDRPPRLGQHRRRPVDGGHLETRQSAAEPDRNVSGPAAEIDGAPTQEFGKPRAEAIDEALVDGGEVGARVGAGARRILHQLGLAHSFQMRCTGPYLRAPTQGSDGAAIDAAGRPRYGAELSPHPRGGQAWRFSWATSPPTSPPSRPRERSASTSGSGRASGACSCRTRRTSPPSAPPSWAWWRKSRPRSKSATSRPSPSRSEERRVGKEGRRGGW